LRWLAQGLADPQRLLTWLDSTTLGDGCGLACVETARGTLLHQIQLDGDRIGRYVIVAPTEWNFHPQGAFVREIDSRPAVTRAKAAMAARRLVVSLDPCVACELRIRDA
jgi:Ni,Fe-hydrogenase I large subunit